MRALIHGGTPDMVPLICDKDATNFLPSFRYHMDHQKSDHRDAIGYLSQCIRLMIGCHFMLYLVELNVQIVFSIVKTTAEIIWRE